MTIWTTDPSGKSASTTYANGSTESRLLSAIPVIDTILPCPPQPPQPSPFGFQNAVKIALGGIIGANALMVAYPAFLPALEQAQWTDLQALIIDANTTAKITAAQYAAIKAAATANNIPVTLP